MDSGKRPLRINEGTRIRALLDADQERVIRVLSELNGNFRKLQNPILRKLLAGRVTIADACKVARCPVTDFMQKMREIGFETDETGDPISGTEETAPAPGQADAGPEAFAGDRVVDFDVRPLLAAGSDPLKALIRMANALQPGECLRVTVSFIPVPLITLLAGKGFVHYTETLAADHIRTWFKKGGAAEVHEIPAAPDHAGDEGHEFEAFLRSADPDSIRYVDVRELEMPQPMLTIMENLETLPDGGVLFVYHKKVPVYFLPQLHEKGFEYLLKRAGEGQVNMLIFKK
ncbi:MAG TPA: DUF2249 domain-containing protein [Sphingobacteriaceae bacterium]